MNIISIDLPWKSDNIGRRVLATTDLDGNVKIVSARDDNELLALVQDSAESKSLILLDIPIDGCEQIQIRKFRPIDKTLARQGIWIQPASGAGTRGKRLKELLKKDNEGVIVQEIYPYAVYKFLAYLERQNMLRRINSESCQALLDASFRKYVPPKYKREREKDKRLENMKYLYSLLMDSSIGLKFSASDSLRCPDSSCTLDDLNRLSDEYDACLGAIVGIYFANNSSYAFVAGDSKSGNILLLADGWLREQLRQSLINLRRELEI